MTQTDPWRCAGCGKHHPVQSLARFCEARHHQLQSRQGSENHPPPDTGENEMGKTYRVITTNPTYHADLVVEDVELAVINDGSELDGALQLLDDDGSVKAMFAPGQWASVEALAQDGGN